MTLTAFLSIVLAVLAMMIYDKLRTVRAERATKRALERAQSSAREDRLAQALIALTALLPPLKDAITQSIGSTADANKFLAGTMTACETIALATDQLRETVTSFSSLITAPVPATSYPADAFQEPASESERQFMGDTFAHMIQHGVTEDVAKQRVRDEEEKKTAISAVQFEE